MSVELLREFVEETLVELRIDRPFISMLKKQTGLSRIENGLRSIANEWLGDVEHHLGHPLHFNSRAQVYRFVLQRLPALIQRYHGNVAAAEQTMYNLLNTRFNSIKGNT